MTAIINVGDLITEFRESFRHDTIRPGWLEPDELFLQPEAESLEVEPIQVEEEVNLTGWQVEVLAIDIFGKERVYYESGNLYIHFPIINISNSLEQRHTIKDMYVKIEINRVYIYGWRKTLSYKEYKSSYSHSHTPFNIGSFSKFCLGSSVFNSLVMDVMVCKSRANWEMLLLSIENYLSWESLEGGPYRKIADIGNTSCVSTSELSSNLGAIMPHIPKECFEVSKIGISFIKGRQDFFNACDKYSKIRELYTLDNEAILEEIELIHNQERGIFWKDKKICLEIVYESVSEDPNRTISREVVEQYENIIEIDILKFNKNLIYERSKAKRGDTIRKIKPFKLPEISGNRKPAKTN